jgi:hypothetical protein
MAGIEDIGGGAVAARNGCPLKLSPVFVVVLEGRWAARQPLGPEIHAVMDMARAGIPSDEG